MVDSPDTTTQRTAAEPERLVLQASDGTALIARLYKEASPVRGVLLVASATGVPQRFYRRFAQHASLRGYRTLTLDYRGIGESKPATLVGYRMDYLDWAERDLAAAVDHAHGLAAGSDVPLFMVGHSYGVHAFGLLDRHADVARFCGFAGGAGWHGWMPRREQWRVLLMWRVLGPLLTRWKGYLPWSLLGMGEDLPLDVYRQWKHWCSFPRYFFDDPALPGLAERFARVHTPMRAVNAWDDGWAPPRSRDAFVAAYRNAPIERIDLTPADGLGPIGHMGYFRPQAKRLWDRTLDWFDAHRRTIQPATPTAPSTP